MPSCPNFIANTFAHLLGGLLLTGISAESPLINRLDKKPITALFIFLLVIFTSYLIINTQKGVFKYILFFIFCVLFGQILVSVTNRLQMKGNLNEILFDVALIFMTMTFIGFVDNQNLIGWQNYLFGMLLILLLSFIASAFFSNEKEKNTRHIWLSRLSVILFAIFIAFDVEILKENAKLCKSPDYINESMNLYLDIANLFSGLGGSE